MRCAALPSVRPTATQPYGTPHSLTYYLNSALHPSGVTKSGKGGNATSAGWQVTLCDPMWHVSSRSSEACCELLCSIYTRTHARTHAHPFNGHFSGTTRVGRYQKGKISLDFTEARDSEWQWHLLYAVCTLLHTGKHASTSVIYRSDALPAAQPTASTH